MVYTKNELEREKSRIKYFKILPSMIINENGDGTTLRKYPYKPGMIIELRPGEIYIKNEEGKKYATKIRTSNI